MRTGLLTALPLFVLLFTAACNLRPAYKTEHQGVETISTSLPAIDVRTDKTRPGQQLRIALEDALPPAHSPLYRLETTLKDNRYPIGIEQSGRISRYNISFTVNYALIDLQTGKAVNKGTVKRMTSYSIVPSDYAAYVGEQDARDRAIEEIAEAMRQRLILYFTKNPAS